MTKTVGDLLALFYQLPESEQTLMVERLTSASEFDDQKFTETYKGFLIEVCRSQIDEKILGRECWTSDYINSSGHRSDQGEIYATSEECLEATRESITWEIQHDEMCKAFEELVEQFKAKNYSQANILDGLADALCTTLEASAWKTELIQAVDKARQAARLPGRGLLG